MQTFNIQGVIGLLNCGDQIKNEIVQTIMT
jgi:hypothetical protein